MLVLGRPQLFRTSNFSDCQKRWLSPQHYKETKAMNDSSALGDAGGCSDCWTPGCTRGSKEVFAKVQDGYEAAASAVACALKGA